MAYDRVLVLAASQDEVLAFGRAFGLDVQFCTGPHNLHAHRLVIELPSFADARKFAIQTALGYWDQQREHHIHMYVEDADWATERAETAPPQRLRTDGYPVFSGIESTGDDTPSSRGTNAQRAQRRALPEPKVDEEDELMLALEGGKRSREPETTGKYVVSLSADEVKARQTSQPVEAPKTVETVVVADEPTADEARWDDNGGAGRAPGRPAKKAAARKTTKNLPEPAPTVEPPLEF